MFTKEIVRYYYMASVTSGKLARFDWHRNIFACPLFSVIDHGPKRVILKSNGNKLRKANSKSQEKKTKQKTI